jgi:hypothetical protein
LRLAKIAASATLPAIQLIAAATASPRAASRQRRAATAPASTLTTANAAPSPAIFGRFDHVDLLPARPRLVAVALSRFVVANYSVSSLGQPRFVRRAGDRD